MQNLLNELTSVLQQDQSLLVDGKLLKAAVIERADKLDSALLKLLLASAPLKAALFRDVDGVLVFDKARFADFVSNKAFLPDSYTAFRNHIGLTDAQGRFVSRVNDVVLAWPYKDCVLEGGMTKEDVGRDELFWNTTLAPDDITRLFEPKALTAFERWDAEAVAAGKPKPVGTIGPEDNLLIKGNNLLALHSLKARYAGQVKLIYIDPPFNTGKDTFKYNDRFSRSAWLTFMRNRLEVMRELLTSDGNIFIHIDINQSHYLKTLGDEVFGSENFIQEIIWSYGSASGGRAAGAKPVNIHDYVLHYARNRTERKQNKLFTPYTEKYIADWFKYEDENGDRYQRRSRGDGQWERQYLKDSPGVPLTTVWTDIKQVYADPRAYKEEQAEHTELVREFIGGQKPEALLKRIIDMASDEGDLIADFFSGTGTTAATAMKLKRRFVTTEQIDSQLTLTRRRLGKTLRGAGIGISKQVGWTGGGSFVYAELAEWNEALGRRVRDAADDAALADVTDEVRANGYLNYKADQSRWDWDAFAALPFDARKQLLLDSLDANHLYVNYHDIADEAYGISDGHQQLNRAFYGDAA